MAQTEEGGNIAAAAAATRPTFAIPVANFQGDLLRRIVSGNDLSQKVNVDVPVEDSDEVELSLGLSLNGRFGVDPGANKAGLHLKRSSSTSDFSPAAALAAVREEEATTTCRVPRPCVVRSCSLPSEPEEEWRKRKELQSLRRMEAKRKRSEKQQRSYNSKMHRDRSRENFEEDRVAESVNVGGGCPPLPPLPPPSESQGTIGSQGSGSSGVTDSDGQAAQVVHKCTEVRSDSNIESLPKSEKEPLVTQQMTAENSGQLDGVVQMENHCNTSTSPHKGTKEIVRNVLENMPSVSTKGDGPNGKRVEGFLYRYKKGEEVRIVCVCHGSFLTPAEFVKHAGGGDVLHPLKHIVVNPTPIL